METIIIKADKKKAKALKQFLKAFGISFKIVEKEDGKYNQDFVDKVLKAKDEKSTQINPNDLWGSILQRLKETAKKDLLKIHKARNKSTINKLEKIFKELSDHPTYGTGNPEKLKHQLSGFWSRRLNKKDRLIYEIIEEPKSIVVVVSALGHY